MGAYNELLYEICELKEAGDLAMAYEKAKLAVTENRLNIKANLLFAEIAFQLEQWLDSYRHFTILYKLQEAFQEEIVQNEDVLNRIEYSADRLVETLSTLQKEEQEKLKADLLEVNSMEQDISKNMFVAKEGREDYFGAHTFDGKKCFMGRYDDWFGTYFNPYSANNGFQSKGEIYAVDAYTSEYRCEVSDSDVILPIAINPDKCVGNEVAIINDSGDKSEISCNTNYKSWRYLRLKESCRIKAKDNMYFGKPMALKHQEKNKRLVLNIFLDSFNWKVIKLASLKELMPYTYEFFKEGIVCDEFYAGSEFTYPSVASYWTGLRSTHHHVLNQNVQFPIPREIPLLSEVYKDQGYLTAKIGGNDSVVPNYGYMRGIDRFVYEKFEQNFHVQNAVAETIEHIEAFREADQFIWAEVLDLHEVSGYWDMPLSVQAKLPVQVNQVDNLGGSSLYQTYSPNRNRVYLEQLRHVDLKLQGLYSYIKKNYKKDEVVVTMMSDHGIGFNVDTGEPFMSDQRINVPLMIYCDWDGEHVCNEKIESIDYGHILCKLSGIEDQRLSTNDGALPRFFGGEAEKQWIFAQSLFPEREYNAAIIAKGYKYYLKSQKLVDHDCTIDLVGSSYSLVNKNNEPLIDFELADECFEIVQNILGNYAL